MQCGGSVAKGLVAHQTGDRGRGVAPPSGDRSVRRDERHRRVRQVSVHQSAFWLMGSGGLIIKTIPAKSTVDIDMRANKIK